MKIIIARHGMTTKNKEKRLSGNSNNAQLTKEGLKHAINLVEVLKKYNIDIIFCSPLKRAIDTAKPIAKELNLKINSDDSLREFDFGLLDGKKEKQKEVFEALKKRRENLNFKFPKGESYNDVVKKVNLFLNKLLKHKFKSILIIAHGGTNRALMYLLNKDQTINLDKIDTPNNVVYIFDSGKKKFSWINTATKERGEGLLFREKPLFFR